MSIYKGTEFVAGMPDMSAYMTTNELLTALYPVGSIYIGTQTTCPLSTLISGSTWELVAQNRALWGGDGTNANTTIAGGLPNITGNVNWSEGGQGKTELSSATGGFYPDNSINSNYPQAAGGTSSRYRGFSFDASRSSSVYGNSTTVQPPAYVVNIWRRTA